MVHAYLAEIQSLQAEGPYTILGECGGGIIAYEIAQQLQSRGQRVASLILMDTPRPQASMDINKRIRYFFTFFPGNYYVEALRYHRERLRALQGKDKLSYFLNKVSRAFTDAPGILKALVSKAPNRYIEYVQRSYTRAIYRYRPKPYYGNITLLVNDAAKQSSPQLGWEDLIKGEIEFYTLPGDHTSYIRDNVRITAEKIKECLEKAESQACNQP